MANKHKWILFVLKHPGPVEWSHKITAGSGHFGRQRIGQNAMILFKIWEFIFRKLRQRNITKARVYVIKAR